MEGLAIRTHMVSGLGEKEVGKHRVGDFWSGHGLVVPLREGLGSPAQTCSWLSQHLGTSIHLASVFFVSFLHLILVAELHLCEVWGGSYP